MLAYIPYTDPMGSENAQKLNFHDGTQTFMLGSQPKQKTSELWKSGNPEIHGHPIPSIPQPFGPSSVAAEGAGEFTSAEASEALRRKAIL